MSLVAWLLEFRGLHERYKREELGAAEVVSYRAARDELARALLAAQHLMIRQGETPRRKLRAARALPVEVDLGKEKVRAMTLDLSAGGFAALLGKPPVPGDQVRVSLRLPGQEPLVAVALVVDVKVQPGTARASFAFRELSEAELERLETFVFDAVLERMA